MTVRRNAITVRRKDVDLLESQVPVMSALKVGFDQARAKLQQAQKEYQKQMSIIGNYAGECAEKLKIDLKKDYLFDPDHMKFVDRQKPESPEAK